MGKLATGALALVVWMATATDVFAQPITLLYRVTITERANVLPNGTTPNDPRVSLSLGPAEAYGAEFILRMTFEYQAGQATGTEFTLHYGDPTFSAIPLAYAAPLIFADEPGAVIYADASTVEQQAIRGDGSGFRNWGAYSSDTVIRAGDVQSGSTLLMSHMRAASFAGPWEFDTDITLDEYLGHMRNNLEFDFTTWTYFYPTGGFTADSYNYRGSAQFLAPPVPEPATWLMMAAGVACLVAFRARQARRLHASKKTRGSTL